MTDAEIIRLLAEKVMGWEKWPDTKAWWVNVYGIPMCRVSDWNPLKDSNHSDQVVDKMKETGWSLRLFEAPLAQALAEFSRGHEAYWVTADDRHHAIAEVALKAIRAWAWE